MTRFAVVLVLVVLSACSSAPSPRRPFVEAPRTGLARGIDLPTDSRDVAQELKGSGLHFVARYYRQPTSRWPALSPEEARTVSANGMKLVAVWESHSHRPSYFSYASGYADALAAHGQARRVGQPTGSAIYFAVDFNAREAEVRGPIDQYFRGVKAGLADAGGNSPMYRVGVYGSGTVCDYLKRMRLAQYAWLSASTAWSGYDSFTDWNIKQGRRSTQLSFDHDMNEARGEYGAFSLADRYSSL
jgi:hypothetical protein